MRDGEEVVSRLSRSTTLKLQGDEKRHGLRTLGWSLWGSRKSRRWVRHSETNETGEMGILPRDVLGPPLGQYWERVAVAATRRWACHSKTTALTTPPTPPTPPLRLQREERSYCLFTPPPPPLLPPPLFSPGERGEITARPRFRTSDSLGT